MFTFVGFMYVYGQQPDEFKLIEVKLIDRLKR